jgi:hypothetical protein
MIDVTTLTDLITQFRNTTASNSVSPDNLGRDFCGIVANTLNDRSFRASLIR